MWRCRRRVSLRGVTLLGDDTNEGRAFTAQPSSALIFLANRGPAWRAIWTGSFGLATAFLGSADGWVRWLVIVWIVVSFLSLTFSEWARGKRDSAVAEQERQALVKRNSESNRRTDAIHLLSLKTKHCVDPDLNTAKKERVIASARQAIMAAIPYLVGNDQEAIRANLFTVHKVQEDEDPYLAVPLDGAVSGRGEPSKTKFRPHDVTYREAIKTEGQFFEKFSHPSNKYVAYATAPVWLGDPGTDTVELFAVLTVDASRDGVLQEMRDKPTMALLANLLAITFAVTSTAESIPCDIPDNVAEEK